MDSPLFLQHIKSYLPTGALQKTLELFEDAGFMLAPSHDHPELGLQSHSILLTDGYLEWMTVSDEERWADHFQDHGIFRKSPKPFVVAFSSQSINLEDAQAIEVGSTFFTSPYLRHSQRFYSIPTQETPGTKNFLLRYESKDALEQKITLRMGDNSIFALGGLVYCDPEAKQQHQTWNDWVTRLDIPHETKDLSLLFSRYHIDFITAEQYQEWFKQEWKSVGHPDGQLGAICLLAKDLDRAAQHFSIAGFDVAKQDRKRLYVKAHKQMGVAMIIEKSNPKDWLPHS
ncbi:MAG: VOC family protein [Bdellovibrionota bacterium]